MTSSFTDTLAKFSPLLPKRLAGWLQRNQEKRTSPTKNKKQASTTPRAYVMMGGLVAVLVLVVGTTVLLSGPDVGGIEEPPTNTTNTDAGGSPPTEVFGWPDLTTPGTLITWIKGALILVWNTAPWWVVALVALLLLYSATRRLYIRKSVSNVPADEGYWDMLHRRRKQRARNQAVVLSVVLLGVAAFGVFVFSPEGTVDWVIRNWQGWTLLFLAAFALGSGIHMEKTLSMGYIPTYLSLALFFALAVGAVVKFLT